jgi:hypothetical protein
VGQYFRYSGHSRAGDPERPVSRFAVSDTRDRPTESAEFCRKRTRRTPKAATQAGFYIADYSGLYLKVKHTKVGIHNQNVLINLGTEYNQELSSMLRASTM